MKVECSVFVIAAIGKGIRSLYVEVFDMVEGILLELIELDDFGFSYLCYNDSIITWIALIGYLSIIITTTISHCF